MATVLNALVPRSPIQPWRAVDQGPDEQVMLTSPLVDLRRDLDRGADVPLMRVVSDRQPSYVRTAVLSHFNGEEWSTGDRTATRIQDADGRDLPLRGVDAVLRRTKTQYDFTATTAFRSRWLPVLPLTTDVQAGGDWRYDVDTMDFAAFDADLNTSQMEWSVTGVDLEYSNVLLERAGSGRDEVDEVFTRLPESLPASVGRLAAQVTRDEPTRYEKARALQSWFREEFTYSLDRVETVDNNALVAFLDPSGRVGYCEQFAASMAVMARTLGIPARVAVGFLVPRRIGTAEWEFSSHDLHAWPELYFPGSGWVRFEPTPSSRASSVPEHTRDEVPRDEPSATASATTSPNTPAPSASAAPDESDPAAQEQERDLVDWGAVATWLLVLLVVGALSLVPQVVRGRRRTRRLGHATPEELWDELRDSALDLGRLWPEGRSPRATGRTVLEWYRPGAATSGESQLSVDELAERLDRVVVAVERSRYDRPGQRTQGDPTLAADVEACVETLAAGSDRSTRWKARWLPRSLTRRP
ncbi:transglutaminaseTgpA domain-containing protein [Nocardioides daphniae]|uniref:transglutaminase family protein n=1 Tax=Nocardioides daphniae TaxID=402297 RepID=UPI003611C996